MTLVELHRDSEVHDIGNGQMQLTTGGGIYNPLPFDGGPRAPGTFIFADGVQQGNWVWISKGEQGYLIKKNTGTVRVYPVRGDQTKYIQISGLADKVCEVNQIDDRNLEIFLDKTYTRWSLKMGPQGFKPEIILKPGWTGTPEWQFRFELNGGLTLEGAKIMDGETQVLIMHKPFVVDANGETRGMTEDWADGVATLNADLAGLTYPIVVDPTLGPASPNQDTTIGEQFDGGLGTFATINMTSRTGRSWHLLYLYDISAIPLGALVTSSDFELYQSAIATDGYSYAFIRCIRTDWEEGNAPAPAKWTQYKTATAWTTPGGDEDYTILDGPFVTSAANNASYVSHSVVNNTQDAIDNRAGIMSMLGRYDPFVSVTNNTVNFDSREGTNVPRLTVVYTVAATFNRSRIVNMGATGPQNRSTIANA